MPLFFLLSPTFSISCHFFCRHPPHPKTAKSGKKRPYYTAQSGHGARITHQTPVSCVNMCNGVQVVEKNMLSLCKSVQWVTRSGKKYAFTVQKCATYFIFNRAVSQSNTPKHCFVCNCVQNIPFTVQKCAIAPSPHCRHCEDEGRSPSERSIGAGKLKVVYSEIASSSACAGFIAMTFSVQKCAMVPLNWRLGYNLCATVHYRGILHCILCGRIRAWCFSVRQYLAFR